MTIPRQQNTPCFAVPPQTALLLAALLTLLLTYAPILIPFNPRLLLGRADLWGYFGPMAFFLDYTLHHGQWPQWNPLLLCGTPYAANPQAALYYPPHLLRALLNIHPTPLSTFISLAIMQAAHLLLLAAGTFALARHYRLRTPAAYAAALGYMSSAALTCRVVQHWPFIAMAAWLPWLLLLLRKTLDAQDPTQKFRYALSTGLVFGLTILIGFPQLTLYCALTLLLYAVLHRVLYRLPEHGPLALRRVLTTDLIALVSLFVLAALIAAPMLLPAAELSHQAARTKAVGAAGTFDNPKQLHPFRQPLDLAQALIFFPGKGGIRMMGAAAFLLALCAIRSRHRRDVLLFAILFFALLDCTLGPPFPLATLISIAAPFRVAGPERAAVLACFMLAMLAGFGIDALLRPKPSRRTAGFWLTAWTLVSLVALGLLLEWICLDPEYPVSRWVWWIPAAAALLLGASFHPRLRCPLAWTLVIAVVAETAAWNHVFIPYLVHDNPYPGSIEPLTKSQTFSLDNQRGVGEKWLENARIFELEPVMNGYEPLAIGPLRDFLCAPEIETAYNRRVYDWEPTRAQQRGNLLLKRRFWLAHTAHGNAVPAKNQLFSPTAAAFLEDAAPNPAPPKNTSVPPETRRVIPLSLPEPEATPLRIEIPAPDTPPQHRALHLSFHATAVGSATIDCQNPRTGATVPGATFTWTPNPASHHAEIPLPDSAPITAVLTPQLEADDASFSLDSAALWEDSADENNAIQILEATANTVRINLANLPAPRLLCFIEAAYPGWQTFLDGKRATIIRAYEVFQAVRVPAGTHQVAFEFDSKTVHYGQRVGLFAALFGATAIGCLWRRESQMTGSATQS